ncbi:hypothetical protein [Campylobacter sp. VTCC 70190]|uniref:hypothetical protein n=1 Tax=Campylobacter sp. VTCC 70190 TaxID=3392118 RepID=UPI00398E98BE
MYRIKVEYLGCMQGYAKPKSIEIFHYKSKQKALEKYRILLVTYLVGYGVVYDDISEETHKTELLAKSLKELKTMELEAICNKEFDYKITVFDNKSRIF